MPHTAFVIKIHGTENFHPVLLNTTIPIAVQQAPDQ